ncbi:hypothetical protein [Streptomyces sp. V3I7]|nr:hypothetical protein [Streptomyces sp. V3I7]
MSTATLTGTPNTAAPHSRGLPWAAFSYNPNRIVAEGYDPE